MSPPSLIETRARTSCRKFAPQTFWRVTTEKLRKRRPGGFNLAKHWDHVAILQENKDELYFTIRRDDADGALSLEEQASLTYNQVTIKKNWKHSCRKQIRSFSFHFQTWPGVSKLWFASEVVHSLWAWHTDWDGAQGMPSTMHENPQFSMALVVHVVTVLCPQILSSIVVTQQSQHAPAIPNDATTSAKYQSCHCTSHQIVVLLRRWRYWSWTTRSSSCSRVMSRTWRRHWIEKRNKIWFKIRNFESTHGTWYIFILNRIVNEHYRVCCSMHVQ